MSDEASPATTSVLAEKSRGAPSLQAAVQAFDGTALLGDWLAGCFAAPRLWQALVSAAADCGFGEGHAGRSGMVFAEHPLIGLAVVAALSPTIHVPLRPGPDKERFGIDQLATRLNADTQLRTWRRGLAGHPRQAGAAYLLRGWGGYGVAVPALEAELAYAAEDDLPVICLLKGKDVRDSSFTLADTEPQTRQILLRVLASIDLPPQAFAHGRLGAAELLDGLMAGEGMMADDILQALNTRSHAGFTRAAEMFQLRDSVDGSGTLADIILREDKPRQAASLFVVSHFRDLAPSTFIELADMLATEVPVVTNGADAPHEPSQVTEAVLEECHIDFVRDAGRRYAEVRSAENGVDIGARIQHLFDLRFPLLRERFLRSMALRLTLGHPSDEIAQSYRELEVQALRELGREQINMRLCWILFGYAAWTRAGRDFLADNRLKITADLARATRRMPAFIAKLFEKGPIDTAEGYGPRDAMQALCVALPLDTDPQWEKLFDTHIGQLFWTSYAANPSELTLAACPPLFGRGDMPADDRQRRRQALLSMLRDTCDAQAVGGATDPDRAALGTAHAAAELLDDTAQHFNSLFQTDAEPFADDFLGEAVTLYFYRVLRNNAWNVIPAWRVDGVEALVEVAISARFKAWLDPASRQAGAQPATRAAHQTKLLALCALDGLLGSAATGPALEPPALTILLLHRLRVIASEEAVNSGLINADHIWEWICAQPDDKDIKDIEQPRSLRRFALDVLSTVPVLLLMAATHRTIADGTVAFTLSEQVAAQLTSGRDGKGRTSLDSIIEAVQTGLSIQSDYLVAFRGWTFPSQGRDQWRDAMRDRQEALRAFQRTLDPLRRHASRGPVRSTTTPVPSTPGTSQP